MGTVEELCGFTHGFHRDHEDITGQKSQFCCVGAQNPAVWQQYSRHSTDHASVPAR